MTKENQTHKKQGKPKILIVRLSAFGDVLHTLPALEAVKMVVPDARISWITEELSACVLKGHPCLEKVYILPRKQWQKNLTSPGSVMQTLSEAAHFFRELRKRRFSRALDFQGNLRSALVAKLSGARRITGYNRQNCR